MQKEWLQNTRGDAPPPIPVPTLDLHPPRVPKLGTAGGCSTLLKSPTLGQCDSRRSIAHRQ
eukprot:5971176-Prymnesium_polylepis.1